MWTSNPGARKGGGGGRLGGSSGNWGGTTTLLVEGLFELSELLSSPASMRACTELACFTLVGAMWHVSRDAWTRNSPGSRILENLGKTRLLSG